MNTNLKYLIAVLVVLFALLSCASTQRTAKTYDKVLLLNKIAKAIDVDDKRSGYHWMQEYEKNYISNEDWMNKNVNYQDYSSAQQIKQAASVAIDKGDWTKAYFLYKLVLPEL